MPEAVCLEPQPLNTCSFGSINDFNVFRKAYNFDIEFVKFMQNMQNNSCYSMCNMSIIQYPYKCPTGMRMKVKSLG